MSMELFDSHAHYYDKRFAEEAEQGAEGILAEVFAGDVRHIINVGTSLENNGICLAQAKQKRLQASMVFLRLRVCRLMRAFLRLRIRDG